MSGEEPWECERWYGYRHKWGKWHEVRQQVQLYDNWRGKLMGDPVWQTHQERTCEVCGFTESDED